LPYKVSVEEREREALNLPPATIVTVRTSALQSRTTALSIVTSVVAVGSVPPHVAASHHEPPATEPPLLPPETACTVTSTAAEVVVLPAASRATAEIRCTPEVVFAVSHWMEYGEEVSSPEMFAPSSLNCTPATPTLSDAVAVMVVMPVTAPAVGCEIVTTGAVVSLELPPGLPPLGVLAPPLPPPPPPHPARTIANTVVSERMRSIKRISFRSCRAVLTQR
jgi:hypothetical protein